MWVGVELFPVIIKSVNSPNLSDRKLAVIYQQNIQQANISADQIRKFLPNQVDVISFNEFVRNPNYGAIFLTHPQLQNESLIQYTKLHKILTFSPFYQAVENGIDTGLVVKEQVKPNINLRQTRAKQIVFKPFFLKVAQVYE